MTQPTINCPAALLAPAELPGVIELRLRRDTVRTERTTFTGRPGTRRSLPRADGTALISEGSAPVLLLPALPLIDRAQLQRLSSTWRHVPPPSWRHKMGGRSKVRPASEASALEPQTSIRKCWRCCQRPKQSCWAGITIPQSSHSFSFYPIQREQKSLRCGWPRPQLARRSVKYLLRSAFGAFIL